jgi:serine/threonine-protein kinase RsbT
MPDESQVEIAADSDLVTARAEGRAVADRLGFSKTDATLIATAISEVARNIVMHAGRGVLTVSSAYDPHRSAVVVVARDAGPGIPDVEAALRQGYGSAGGLGMGLPGTRRIMDELEIETDVGKGTTVTMRKWRERDELERLHEKRYGSDEQRSAT